jgi:hypothetical protein
MLQYIVNALVGQPRGQRPQTTATNESNIYLGAPANAHVKAGPNEMDPIPLSHPPCNCRCYPRSTIDGQGGSRRRPERKQNMVLSSAHAGISRLTARSRM